MTVEDLKLTIGGVFGYIFVGSALSIAWVIEKLEIVFPILREPFKK